MTLKKRVRALEEALEGFVRDLTGSLRNRETMLTINHDALCRRIEQAQAALRTTDTRQAYLAEVRSQITKGDRECIAAPTEASTLADVPVAWRWRYLHPGRINKWTVCQSPRQSIPASPGFVGIEAEPLYAAPPVDRNAVLHELDRQLARCLDLLSHIRGTGRYPPDGDPEALAELNEHIASGDRARAALRTEPPAQVEGGE